MDDQLFKNVKILVCSTLCKCSPIKLRLIENDADYGDDLSQYNMDNEYLTTDGSRNLNLSILRKWLG